MKDFPVVEKIQQHKSEQKARIYKSFAESDEDSKNAKLITKADFESNFPLEQYEVYSLGSIQKFRDDLQKSENYSDEMFKAATKGLEHFIVQHEGNKVIMFTRKKEVGEK